MFCPRCGRRRRPIFIGTGFLPWWGGGWGSPFWGGGWGWNQGWGGFWRESGQDWW